MGMRILYEYSFSHRRYFITAFVILLICCHSHTNHINMALISMRLDCDPHVIYFSVSVHLSSVRWRSVSQTCISSHVLLLTALQISCVRNYCHMLTLTKCTECTPAAATPTKCPPVCRLVFVFQISTAGIIVVR